ncbi:MAG: ABC transporter ATP-binding protein [Nitrososphaeria archaeon]
MPVVVDSLYKRIGSREILHNITFSVNDGEIFGLVGPNGAGKTTTMRVLATLLLPDSGKILVDSMDIVKDQSKIRKKLAYVPEEAGIYKNITGYEYLRFVAHMFSDSGGIAENMVKRGAALSGLEGRLNDRTKSYSRGMKRRLQIARALMVNPRLALLDEPTAGIDVTYTVKIRKMVREYAKNSGAMVVLSSHNMYEVEALCDRIAMVHHGKIIALGTPRELAGGENDLEAAFMKMVGDYEI